MGRYVDTNLVAGEHVVYEARLHWIIFVSVEAAATLWLGPVIERACTEIAITNKRIIIKLGWLQRRTLEMNLGKVESVNVDQSVLRRLLDYGSITITGAGGTRELFHNIERPLEFRKAFQAL